MIEAIIKQIEIYKSPIKLKETFVTSPGPLDFAKSAFYYFQL
jgi:hypothetical protein